MEINFSTPLSSLGVLPFPDWQYQMDTASSLENVYGPDNVVVVRGTSSQSVGILGTTE